MPCLPASGSPPTWRSRVQLQRRGQRGFGDAERGRGDVEAAVVEHLHGGLEAAAFVAEAIRRGHPHRFEGDLEGMAAADAHQLLGRRELTPGRSVSTDEGVDAARAGVASSGEGRGTSLCRVRDEALDAVDAVVVAVAHGARAQVGPARAAARFGQREAGQPFAAGGARQVARALGIVAADQHRVGAQVVSADHRGSRGAGARDLDQRQQHRRRRHAGAAPALGQVHAHHAERGELRHMAAGRALFLVDGARERRDGFGRSSARPHRPGPGLLR